MQEINSLIHRIGLALHPSPLESEFLVLDSSNPYSAFCWRPKALLPLEAYCLYGNIYGNTQTGSENLRFSISTLNPLGIQVSS